MGELSETMLGHSKLSELLQDCRFGDICDVRLDTNGYTVVQRQIGDMVAQQQHSLRDEIGTASFCLNEPLCLADAGEPNVTPVFEPTPGPFGAPVAPRYESFGESEPVSSEDADGSMNLLSFGPTPVLFGQTPMPSQSSAVNAAMPEDQDYLKQFLQGYLDHAPDLKHVTDASLQPFCPHEPLSLDEAVESVDVPDFGTSPNAWSPAPRALKAGSPAPRALAAMPVPSCELPSFAPWKDGQLSQMVQRTFIHAPLSLPTLLPGTLPRSSSTGDLSGSTSARSTSSPSRSFDNALCHQEAELFKASVCGMSSTFGVVDLSPAPTFVVPTVAFDPRFASTVPLLNNIAPCPPCPPPPLPPVLRLSDHLR